MRRVGRREGRRKRNIALPPASLHLVPRAYSECSGGAQRSACEAAADTTRLPPLPPPALSPLFRLAFRVGGETASPSSPRTRPSFWPNAPCELYLVPCGVSSNSRSSWLHAPVNNATTTRDTGGPILPSALFQLGFLRCHKITQSIFTALQCHTSLLLGARWLKHRNTAITSGHVA